mmetsp:Transcript_8123/g.23925  ORF Transcript_8123/g.23925 Transcript_8123/m.23925 type:complete len:249 (-) Transcript_8123:13-759(-)
MSRVFWPEQMRRLGRDRGESWRMSVLASCSSYQKSVSCAGWYTSLEYRRRPTSSSRVAADLMPQRLIARTFMSRRKPSGQRRPSRFSPTSLTVPNTARSKRSSRDAAGGVLSELAALAGVAAALAAEVPPPRKLLKRSSRDITVFSAAVLGVSFLAAAPPAAVELGGVFAGGVSPSSASRARRTASEAPWPRGVRSFRDVRTRCSGFTSMVPPVRCVCGFMSTLGLLESMASTLSRTLMTVTGAGGRG